MTKGMWYVLAAAAAVYVLLRPRRGMVGSTKTAATRTDGVGTQIGALVDGAWKVGKELFGKSGIVMGEDAGTSPPDLSGLAVAPGERADFI